MAAVAEATTEDWTPSGALAAASVSASPATAADVSQTVADLVFQGEKLRPVVLALQTAYSLEQFGVKLFIGKVVSLSLVRELAPVLMSLMVGGRVGAGIAAEIGTMKVTEQIDALRALALG